MCDVAHVSVDAPVTVNAFTIKVPLVLTLTAMGALTPVIVNVYTNRSVCR